MELYIDMWDICDLATIGRVLNSVIVLSLSDAIYAIDEDWNDNKQKKNMKEKHTYSPSAQTEGWNGATIVQRNIRDLWCHDC